MPFPFCLLAAIIPHCILLVESAFKLKEKFASLSLNVLLTNVP